MTMDVDVIPLVFETDVLTSTGDDICIAVIMYSPKNVVL
jgi:hypothetical protein